MTGSYFFRSASVRLQAFTFSWGTGTYRYAEAVDIKSAVGAHTRAGARRKRALGAKRLLESRRDISFVSV